VLVRRSKMVRRRESVRRSELVRRMGGRGRGEIFKNILGGYSGAPGLLNHEKKRR